MVQVQPDFHHLHPPREGICARGEQNMGTSNEFERLERLIQLTPQGTYRVELEARLAAGAVTGGSEEEPASTPRQSQELPALPRRGGDDVANEVREEIPHEVVKANPARSTPGFDSGLSDSKSPRCQGDLLVRALWIQPQSAEIVCHRCHPALPDCQVFDVTKDREALDRLQELSLARIACDDVSYQLEDAGPV